MVKGKGIDTWKLKSWYTAYSPEAFEGKEIATLIAADEKSLYDRVLRVGLDQLTGDVGHAYTTLAFRVISVKGNSVQTKLIGHELSKSYLRTIVRRRKDIISVTCDATTRDGVSVRLKANAYSANRLSTSARTLIRNAMAEEMAARAGEMDFYTLMQEIVFRKFATRLFGRIKKIAPMKKVELRKSEVKESFAA